MVFIYVLGFLHVKCFTFDSTRCAQFASKSFYHMVLYATDSQTNREMCNNIIQDVDFTLQTVKAI